MSNLIYKYSSLDSAIKIIKTSSVLLNAPSKFNDPFDSILEIDEKDKAKSLNLIINYFTFKILCDFVENPDLNLKKTTDRLLINTVKGEVALYRKLIKKQITYDHLPFFDTIIKKISSLNDELNVAIESAKTKFEDETLPKITESREKARITCFSKRNDSILMWSHYANSHSGVCFEFEEDRPFFKDVIYSEERPKIDLYKAMSRILGYDYVNEKITYQDKVLIESILTPFFVKSKEWSYEEEVRCLLSDEELNTEGFEYRDGKEFLKMKISKIYIGTKASGEKLNEILSLASHRAIPVVFMKESKDRYAIIPDYEKHIKPIEKSEKAPNSLELLENEIKSCLDSKCYVAAMSLALSVPSIIGRLVYPELNEKDAYIKWYQENIGQYEHDSEQSKDKMPYPSGDVCYALKKALQDNCDTNISGSYNDFDLSCISLKVEDKNYFDMYGGESSIERGFDGDILYKLEISVRDFCWKICRFIDIFLKENTDNKYEIPSFSIRRFDKQIDELNEINAINETLRKRIGGHNG